MIYGLTTIGILVLAFIIFVWWRYTSVARGARQRDEKLFGILAPLEPRLERKDAIDAAEVFELARRPQLRPMLYEMLKYYERLDLFPAEYRTQVAQGEGALAYWLMHPNELEEAPSEMELVEEVDRAPAGEEVKFFVYRFRMPAGHREENSGWLLGLAGPFFSSDVPYSVRVGAFSRFGDTQGKITPGELVDWWLAIMVSKGAWPAAKPDEDNT